MNNYLPQVFVNGAGESIPAIVRPATNGLNYVVPTWLMEPNAPKLLGVDADTRLVVETGSGDTFGLTLCCFAYDKGSEDGVVCRGCHNDWDYGVYNPKVEATLL